ncbi:kinase-like domain-containing protein, partial [Irpex lacteus]
FIAKYELGSFLGRGGNGFVLQARRRTDDQQVAVKIVLKKDRAAHWPEHPTYGRVSRDVIYMDLARHKNIISLLDVFSDDTCLYIVSPIVFMPANLHASSYIEAFGPLPLDAAKHIFYQLVDAVALLHSKGITHCDIKPENILLDADTLDIKLIDFGNSMQLPAHLMSLDPSLLAMDPNPQDFHGTKAYTPPEILNHEHYSRHAADIWAMGIVLCEMIVG